MPPAFMVVPGRSVAIVAIGILPAPIRSELMTAVPTLLIAMTIIALSGMTTPVAIVAVRPVVMRLSDGGRRCEYRQRSRRDDKWFHHPSPILF